MKIIAYLICITMFLQSTLEVNASELSRENNYMNSSVFDVPSEESTLDIKISEIEEGEEKKAGNSEPKEDGEKKAEDSEPKEDGEKKAEDSEPKEDEEKKAGNSEPKEEGEEKKIEDSEPKEDEEKKADDSETEEDENETEKLDSENSLKVSETENKEIIYSTSKNTRRDSSEKDVVEEDDDPLYGRIKGYVNAENFDVQVLSLDDGYSHDDKFINNNYKIHNIIDVSKYQENIDWLKVKQSGIDYAIIRAGYRGYGDEGSLNTDSYFEKNIKAALAVGIEVGVYFFSQAITEVEAVEEADYLLNLIADYEIELPVVIDYEYAYDIYGEIGRLYNANLSIGAATKICKQFCKVVEDNGYSAMVYANKSMLENSLDVAEIAKDYKIWLAHYANSTNYVGEYEFWQYTSKGSIDGITTNVDLSFWYKAEIGKCSEITDGIYIIRSALDKNKVLDVLGGLKESGTNIQLYTDNGTKAQQFAVKQTVDGKYNIYSYQSGMAVTVDGGKNANGTNVLQFYPLSEEKQVWSIIPTENELYKVVSDIGGKVLDVSGAQTYDGTNIQIYESNESYAQQFYFEKIGDLDGFEIFEGELEDGTYVISSSIDENKVLSVGEETNVQLYTSNNIDAQRFVIQKDNETGFYKIASKKSGMWMSYLNENLMNCSNVYLADVETQWEFRHIRGDYYTIYAPNSSFCLDVAGAQTVDGTKINMYQSNQTYAQIFKLKKENNDTTINRPMLEDGVYLIHTGNDDNKVLEIEDGSKNTQGNVQINKKNGSTAQLFVIKKTNDGVYNIFSYHSKLPLTVDGGLNADGVNVYQYFQNDSESQMWKIVPTENEYYKVISSIGNKVLDLTGGCTDDGTNIQIYSDNGTMAQRFRFEKVSELEEEDASQNTLEEGTYKILSVLDESKGLAVADNSLMVGANIQLHSSNISEQQFVVEKNINTGFYTITSKNAGLQMTYANGDLSNFTNVYQDIANSNVGNQWRLEYVEGDYYKIYAEDSSYCVDVAGACTDDGTNIHIYLDNGTDAQLFKFEKTGTIDSDNQNANAKIENGVYIIETTLEEGKVLDVTAGSVQNGANIQIYEANGTFAQQFEIIHLTNGNYTITAKNSGKMLTTKYGDFSDGANVYQDNANSSINQQWKIVCVAKGEYSFISAYSGKVLDVAGAKTTNGTNVQVHQSNLSKGQRFKIIPVVNNITASLNLTEDSFIEFRLNANLSGQSQDFDDFYYIMQAENYTSNIIGEPIEQIEKEKNISFTSTEYDRNRLKELAMQKLVLAVKTSDGNYQAISDPIVISNPEALATNTSPIFQGTSKKGLQGIAYSSYDGGSDIVDARNANTKHTLLNLDLASVVTTDPNKDGYIEYTYKGNTYYFSDLSDLKKNIQSLNYGYQQYLNGNTGRTPVAVSLCLLLSYNSENSYLIDPAARTPGHSYYMLNVREEKARETLEALFLYLGETFGQENCFVSNWILGNEINSSRAWNFNGNLDFDNYMECYATAFRLLYNGVKSEKTGNTVCVSLDNGWMAAPDTYAGKRTLDTFAQKIYAQNPNVEWSIAYHPYSYPLTRADFWNDYKNTTDSLSTPYISMRNINVLTDYAGTLERAYGRENGSIRVLLTEQGYSYAAGARTQAEAIARGYYIAEFNDRIDAFIIRAVVDDPDEASGRLYFGLMNSQHEKRIAFYVYEYMDSSRSGFAEQSSSIVSDENRNKFETAKSIVCDTNWSAIIPGFDDSKLGAIK